MNWLRNLWLRVSGTRLALVEADNQRLAETNAALEEENARLQRENRALTNTILGQAGVAPLPPAEEVKAVPRVRHLTAGQQRRRLELVADRSAIQQARELRDKVFGKKVSNG